MNYLDVMLDILEQPAKDLALRLLRAYKLRLPTDDGRKFEKLVEKYFRLRDRLREE